MGPKRSTKPKKQLNQKAKTQQNAATSSALGQKRAAESVTQEEPKKQCTMEISEVRAQMKSMLLASVKDGAVATSKVATYIPPMPDLHIDGYGRVPLPINETVASSLKSHFEPAPYGLGEATILDEKVRRSFQLSPKKFELKNKNFMKVINEKVIGEVKEALGCKQSEVRAEVYKLLMYEKGGHFKPHRDTEKENGMFATLIVQLPSDFTGGDLVVTHGGKKQTIKFNHSESASVCMYAAHYSDVQHEIKEIKSGFRMAVVYSLCWNGNGIAPSTPSEMNEKISNMQRLLVQLSQSSLPGTKTAWSLEHMYSKEALWTKGLKALKGKDKGIGEIVSKAVASMQEEDNYTLLLVQYCKHEEQYGCCKQEERMYAKHSGKNCFLFTDTGDVDYELENFISTDGRPMHIESFGDDGDMKKDILNADSSGDAWWGKYEAGECSGPSGNEGSTRELWYRRTLLLFWKADDYLDVLANTKLESGASYLRERLFGPTLNQHLNYEGCFPILLRLYDCPTDADTVAKETAHLLDIFMTKTSESLGSESDLLKVLCKLDRLEFVKNYLSLLCHKSSGRFFINSFSTEGMDYLSEAVKKYTWPVLEAGIRKLFEYRKLPDLMTFLEKCPSEVPKEEFIVKLGETYLKDGSNCAGDYHYNERSHFNRLVMLQLNHPEACRENLQRLPNLEKLKSLSHLVATIEHIQKNMGKEDADRNSFYKQMITKCVEIINQDPLKLRTDPYTTFSSFRSFYKLMESAGNLVIIEGLNDILKSMTDVLDSFLQGYRYEVKSPTIKALSEWREKNKASTSVADNATTTSQTATSASRNATTTASASRNAPFTNRTNSITLTSQLGMMAALMRMGGGPVRRRRGGARKNRKF